MNHIFIIGFVWPEPNSSAAGIRMLQLIHLFLSKNWKITFASPATHTQHMLDLDALGITTCTIEINNPSFDHLIKKLQPDVVVFDRFMIEEQFGWRVAKHCPNTLRILNTEDLHSLRKTRQECFKKNKKHTFTYLFASDYTKREIASIYRCDLSLLISDFEMKILKSTFKIEEQLLHYFPLLSDPITSAIKNHWPSFEEREHFITIGNFRHDPNWNAILYLKQTIWPLIRKEVPQAELHIYGAYPPPKATQLDHKNEGFLIKGWAKDAREVVKKSRVCLAPLRFGAGIKGKLVEAMLCGTPSITTTIGAEGILGEDSDWSGFIANTPEKIAKAAIALYSNKNMWHQSQQNGIEIINTRFQKNKHEPILITKIEELLSNLTKHRSQNFIGSMLQFHTLRSTEFMSRWIEEKHK
ncbi:glycosyltransferase [Aquimarina sp. U1-2]|uniref:glycosyltransferase n=1 Tax=Aquimarina sp. U1-2 TaxID=2823141 RepID=UPI001FEE466E|nr:glycosyltransferase [Aquimarina sp. U1-2]